MKLICLRFFIKRVISNTRDVKKLFLFVFCILTTFNLFSQGIPDSLKGIWESKDRYIFFEENDNSEPELVVILKTYYGWYLDRAAEPESYNQQEERTKNTATAKNAVNIKIQKIKTKSTEKSLYGTLDLVYSKSQINTIPFFILNDDLYLTYFEKDISDDEISTTSSKWNFYRGVVPTKGFQISPQTIPSNISGYIIDGEKLYDVRYWQTYMDFSSEYVNFSYNEDSYQIPKHIDSCGANFSCVTGQSKKVRNTVKPFEYKAENYIYNDDGSVFTKNEEPYLKKLAGKESFEELMNIVKEANARRKPDAEPLFPESNLDWHWDLIDMLEKDNTIIQQVRARQEAFGPRSH